MRKTLIIGSIATALTLGLVGGTIVLAHGTFARAGWDGPGPLMGGPMMNGATTGAAMPLFDAFDRSANGEISQADIDAVRTERLAAFDSDGDGALTLDEYEALWLDAMHTRMVRGFQRLDVDGDTLVTAEEFLAPFNRIVDRFDRGGDGLITEDEVREEMRERLAAMRGRRDRWHNWGRGDVPDID